MNTEVETTVDTSSENDVEVANPQMENDSNTEVDSSTEVQNEESKPIDVNAIAAAARRKAEQDARNQMKAIDDEYARRFAGYKNPITGEPIRSQADYLRALDAQEEMNAKQQLADKGIDPELITNLVNNNPKIRQAEMVMATAERVQNINRINSEVEELGRLDPSIKSLSDIPADVIEMVTRTNGVVSLVDAYKIANYGKVSDSKQAAITQNAINQAKSKSHLNPVNGVATPDDGVEIPNDVLTMWKDAFPDKSSKELKALYNKSL